MERITLLENRRVILGATGSIAVYKAVDLASKLTQAGALVDVVMTEAAHRFVTPLAFQSVTGRPVYTDMWQPAGSGALPTHIAHVGLGEGASLLLIAPVTAKTSAKLANGYADNLLTVTALAARCPVMIAPAMDGGMYLHPATQANVNTLMARGVYLIEPEEGRFASGLVGKGRLPETAALIGHVRRVMGVDGPLRGQRVVITAGGTQEAIDPVRFVTNRSTGKQGYALAQAALDAGAEVTLITTASLPAPVGAMVVPVESAAQMHQAVMTHSARADVLIMAAAVADFRPETVAEQKIKKQDEGAGLTLPLARTQDILLAVAEARAKTGYPRFVTGFAAESQDLLTNAAEKLARKRLDLLVANDITAADAGFGTDTNRVLILEAGGAQQALPLASKARVSESIIAHIADRLGGR